MQALKASRTRFLMRAAVSLIENESSGSKSALSNSADSFAIESQSIESNLTESELASHSRLRCVSHNSDAKLHWTKIPTPSNTARNTPSHSRLLAKFAAILLALVWLGSANAATVVVTTTSDSTSNDSICSLREAITATNSNTNGNGCVATGSYNTTAQDTINFGIASPVIGEIVIQPSTELPTITQPVVINGYSQSGTSVNTLPLSGSASNAVLRIRLHGILLTTNGALINVCSNGVTIRGLSFTGADNTQLPSAIEICSSVTQATIVRGNFFGLMTDGVTLLDNDRTLLASGPVAFGGSSAADRNVVGDSNFVSLILQNNADGSSILGNLLGFDKNGTPLGNQTASGVQINTNNVVLGSTSAPNWISSGNPGIRVISPGVGNDFFANHFLENDGLGIDLNDSAGGTGVSVNDNLDADIGGNGLQNYLDDGFAATRVATGIQLQGTLRRPLSGTIVHTYAAYASESCDSSGHGEGEQFLGSANVSSTSGAATTGARSVTVTIPAAQPPLGSFITHTVTGPDGTSEFSACVQMEVPLIVNSNNDVVDANGCNATHCSLREAINAANANSDASLIEFAIAPLTGTSEIMIQPTSPLPTIIHPVTIDGYSQPGTSVNTLPLSGSASNAVLRIRVDGINAGSVANGLAICASDVAIKGLSMTRFGQRGLVFGGNNANSPCGGVINGRVEGNFLGLASDGLTAAGNIDDGIRVSGAKVNVGSNLPAGRNVLSSNGDSGVSYANPASSSSSVLGNLIGMDKSGLLDRGQTEGVAIDVSANGVSVGLASAPNWIRFNTNGIVTFSNAGQGNVWWANFITNNDNLGIDISTNGLTLNDPDDADLGPNGFQNFPVITSAERTTTGIRVRGTLDVKTTVTNGVFTIGVYANAACDVPSGHGEGQFYLGSANVTLSNGGSSESFTLSIPTEVDLVANAQITTTATGDEGSSEFSQCITAVDEPPGITVDSALDIGPTAGGCDATGDANECTLREAITLANSQAGADLIRFEIAGAGPHNISIATLLPDINQPLTIDGYTQPGAVPNAADGAVSDAVIQIQLRDGASVTNGLMTCSNDVTIRGLSITGFGNAIVTRMNSNASCSVDGTNVKIAGNFIGLLANGTAPVADDSGILVASTVVTIGGPTLADRNVIAGNASVGVLLLGAASSGSVIQNNLFGVEPDGTTVQINSGRDVEIAAASNMVVGGEGNLMNHFRNGLTAILITGNGSGPGASVGNTVYANEFSNYRVGTAIDIGGLGSGEINGIDVNDINDTDAGANNKQNSPVLSDGVASATALTLNGTLDVASGAPPASYRLALYESTSCNDNSGVSSNGREGQIYLGNGLVTISGSAENFSIQFAMPPVEGTRFLTATVTAPDGSTSEFSNCLLAPRPDGLFEDSFE